MKSEEYSGSVVELDSRLRGYGLCPWAKHFIYAVDLHHFQWSEFDIVIEDIHN